MLNPSLTAAVASVALLAAMPIEAASPTPAPSKDKPAASADNPLLVESTLPYKLPPFDKIKNEHFGPAYATALAEHLKEIEAIANNKEAASFDNTLVAMERSGQTLERVENVFGNLAGAHTNPEIQKLEAELAPKLSAHRDAIRLNPKLFTRIQELHDKRDQLKLDPESKYLLERYYKDFVRAGAKLSDADKEKLKAMNAELATLQTKFSQSVLKEKNADAVIVDTREELAGMSEGDIAAAAAAAKDRKLEGKFVIALLNTSGQPALASLQNRALRERIMKTSLARNSKGGEFDTREMVIKIARLRAERAKLLGYEHHAAYQLEDQTAKSVATVNKLMNELAPAAVTNARKEAAELQATIKKEGGDFDLASWDWSFYAEKALKDRFAFDESQLKPYFEMNRVLVDGVFHAATQLYGITFKERKELPAYQEDVRVWEVFDADGKPLALFLTDFYARPSKRGGAWMNEYVGQSGLFGTKPVVANHLNIPKPPAGEPTLLTFDEVTTMFHEFGHALHGMFSNVKYPRFAGTSVPRDFVEFPSQVNEMWRIWPEILRNYAKHHKTGEPMPQELLDKMLASQKFGEGFRTTEYLASTLLDQAWHQIGPEQIPDDALAFEAEALKKVGVDLSAVPPRYRTAYFSHTFAGGYSAGYYSYIWSEVLDANTVEWIKKNGGLKRENGDRFRKMLLSRGGSEDAVGQFRKFTGGGEPELDALLERRGLVMDGATAEAPAEIAPEHKPKS
ncbi:MAG TPA: M3 family metallopeptidase [Chthoniobacterales bacterium]|nr:M3 family metallopeptidase [Chthoniobacterales bacterium]